MAAGTATTVATSVAQLGVNYCAPVGDLNYLFWLAVALMVSVVAILFMIGRSLQRKDLEAIARDEIKQVALSVVIGIVIVSVASAFCMLSGVMIQNIGGGSMTHFQYAGKYLNALINNIGMPVIKNLWSYSYFFTNLAQIGPAEYRGSNIMNGFSIVAQAAETINGYVLVPLVSSLGIQQILLQAAEAFSFTLLLPCGMILRVIRPTRMAGCFLIAASFGAYVIWPMTYVINYQITMSIFPEFEQGISETMFGSFLSAIPSAIMDPLGTLRIASEKLFLFLDEAAILLPQAVVLPVLSLVLTTTFIGVFTEYLHELR